MSIDGQTPLFVAATMGRPEIIRILLNGGACVDMPMATVGNTRLTPLDAAAVKGNAACVEVLLNAGAKLDLGGNPKYALNLAKQCLWRCIEDYDYKKSDAYPLSLRFRDKEFVETQRTFAKEDVQNAKQACELLCTACKKYDAASVLQRALLAKKLRAIM